MTNDTLFLPPAIDIAISLVALGAVVFLVTRVVRRSARVRPVDVDWLAGGLATGLTQPVYQAYLRRHWRLRTLGFLVGMAVAVVGAIRWPGDTVFSISVGNGPIGTDLLVCLLAGATIGTLAAETYRLGTRHSPRRQARLEARPSRPQPKLNWTARAIAAAAIVPATLGTMVMGKPDPIGGALLAVTIVILAEATQAAITDRRRFPNSLVDDVDQRLRAFAGRSVAWLELSGAVLGFGWSLSAFEPADPWAELGMVTARLACLIVAIVALLRSSGRAPRHWQPMVAT